MKKILSLALIILMLVPQLVFADVSFPDLTSEHWAYEQITELVANGTILGYEDGYFRPDNIVTRAEFVKMIGEGSEIKNTPYKDVDANHWGYSYIMSSGLEADDMGNFNPSVPITRDTVVELLWKRNGEIKNVWAPSIITRQSSNKSAVAWAYVCGLMQGDDGVNLRLTDSLKRSEAAALIVRASKADAEVAGKKFEDVVNPLVVENAYNALKPFDGEYSPEKIITNGEMARAALKIGCEETEPSYQGFSVSAPFEHEYAKDIYILGHYVAGDEKITESFANAEAKFADTVAFLSYNFIRKSAKAWDISKTTPELKDKVSGSENSYITFAISNGIINLSDIDFEASVTQKDFTILLMKFDSLIGSQSDITTETNKFTQKSVKKDHSLSLSAYNEAPDFALKLKNIPDSVYAAEFEALEKDTKLPKDTFTFAKEFNMIFVGILEKYKDLVKKNSGAEVIFTFYPSLCFDNGSGYTMRVKCEFIKLNESSALGKIFPLCNETAADISVSQGESIFIDLETGVEVASMDLPADGMFLNKVIK